MPSSAVEEQALPQNWGNRRGNSSKCGRSDSVAPVDRTAARYGGEEFAILPAGADLCAAASAARQIGETLAGKWLVNKRV